ncbi:MAG: serine hydrolase, partial [Phormidesmis sp.]
GRVPPPRGLSRKRRRASKYAPILRYGVQLLIVGLGIAAIGGTLLKMWPSAEPAAPTEIVRPDPKPSARSFPLALTQEIPALKAAMQELPNLYPGLTPKIFYADVDTGEYISQEGSETVAAASTIKLPILLAFFEAVDAGRIDPDRQIAIQSNQVAQGSGDMQLSAPGTQFTALEVASQMIINSDNTATNMMIDLLGGQDVLNSWFQAQGLEKTQLNTPLPDLAGTNTTSARDLAHTMLLISQGEGLQMRSRDRVLNILNRTYNKSLLASGPMDQGALTYNKTGDIESALGDIALIDLPNGKRYVIAVLVERPANDGRAQELIRRISGLTYEEAAKAVQPSVAPSENSEGAEGVSSGARSPTDASTGTSADEPNLDEPYIEETYTEETYTEEPYPSADP